MARTSKRPPRGVDTWFEATPAGAMGLLVAPPTGRFDLSDAQRTNQLLGRQTGR